VNNTIFKSIFFRYIYKYCEEKKSLTDFMTTKSVKPEKKKSSLAVANWSFSYFFSQTNHRRKNIVEKKTPTKHFLVQNITQFFYIDIQSRSRDNIISE
jgi:hypothetical protein